MSDAFVPRNFWRAVRAFGVRGVVERGIRRARDRRDYARWVREREVRGFGGSRHGVAGRPGPLISILMPTHESDPRWLARAIESVRGQCYERWELCIADDASTRSDLRGALAARAAEDPRIRVVYRDAGGHISAASNSALTLARGEFVALLDHDDELAPDALERVAAELSLHPDTDLVYSDEDKLDARGRRVDAYLKPDFGPDLLLSQNFVSHLGVYRTELVRALGGFREGLEGSQDHDLVLRVSDRSSPCRMRHLAHVLYHWRATPQSTSGGLWRKEYAHEAGRRAIADHLARLNRRGEVEASLFKFYRVRYLLPDPPPSVSIVAVEPLAPSLGGCVARAPRGMAVEVVPVPAAVPGGLAACLTAAVRSSRGTVVVLLGSGVSPEPGWIEELASQAVRPEIGIVGGRILSPSRRVMHAGFLLRLDWDPPVLDAHRGLHEEAPGHFGRARLVQNLTAVSAECMAVRREVFEALAGFDVHAYPDGLFDVDFCLRTRESGLRVLFTPHASVVRHCSHEAPLGARGSPAERETLRTTWRGRLPRDPYWHPAMDRGRPDFRLLL